MAGGNAGLIKPKVQVLSSSPFSSFRKQEQSTYITTETFYSISSDKNIVPLNAPINGCRLQENKSAYDNYLIDSGGLGGADGKTYMKPARLEEAMFTQQYEINNQNVEQVGEFSASATARAMLGKTTGKKESREAELQRQFFTWQCRTSIFGDVPRRFTEPPQPDGAAEWTYISVPKPGLSNGTKNGKESDDKVGGSSVILMPYQRKIPKDKTTPVHWGLGMNNRPFNQPFELTYYLCYRDASIAELAPEQRTGFNRFSFYYPDANGKPGKPIKLNLNKGLYMAIELGEETSTQHYLLLFSYGQKPMFFWITKGESSKNSGSQDTQNSQQKCLAKRKSDKPKAETEKKQETTQNGEFKATLVATYDNDSIVENMFNTRLFTLSIESAGGIFYIRSSAFVSAPWMIHPNVIDRASGLFIGSTISVYGGNIQSGVSYAPIQYQGYGMVQFAGVTFDIPHENPPSPTISVSSLGPSQILQEQSTSSDGKSTQRLMVDTENLKMLDPSYKTVVGQNDLKEFGYVNTLLGGTVGGMMERKIVIVAEESSSDFADEGVVNSLMGKSVSKSECDTIESNMDISVFDAFGVPKKLLAFKTGNVTTRTYYPVVYMTASDVTADSGYVIPFGRSPYLWMIRLFVEPDKEASTDPIPVFDLSCDVMSIDLSWNSTGPGEVTCSGSMKLLANPRTSDSGPESMPDLMDLTKRISYITIDVERSNSVIPDGPKSIRTNPKGGEADQRIFTGCIVGVDVQEEPGKTILNCKIEDYMWVLQAVKFNLSPWYDGMFYNYAVADMVAQTGLPYDRMRMNDTSLIPVSGSDGPDMNEMPCLACANMFEQPNFRFKDGDSIKDGISKIAKLNWSIFYFDQWGNFRYDDMPWGMCGNKPGTVQMNFFTGDDEKWQPENLVWNSFSKSYDLKNFYNAIQIITVSKVIPSLYIMFQDINRDSIEEPFTKGYIGFPKAMRQKEALFERTDSVMGYFNDLKDVLYLPPRTIRFETYGRVGLRPATVVNVDGEPWRMMNINLKLDASKNEFWASVEGEWFDHKGKTENGDPKNGSGKAKG